MTARERVLLSGTGDDIGRSSDAIPSLGAPLAAMLYIPERDLLVVITVQNQLTTFKLADNRPVQMLKAKLSVGRDGLMDSCFCGLGLLACVSNDQVVRVNDLIEDNEADDNFILTLADVPGMCLFLLAPIWRHAPPLASPDLPLTSPDLS